MRISDWSSDVCSSDLPTSFPDQDLQARRQDRRRPTRRSWSGFWKIDCSELRSALSPRWPRMREYRPSTDVRLRRPQRFSADDPQDICSWRSEEHTSELQSLMRISYAVFGLKKK